MATPMVSLGSRFVLLASRFDRFTRGECSPDCSCVGCWVAPQQLWTLWREWNPDFSVVQTVALDIRPSAGHAPRGREPEAKRLQCACCLSMRHRALCLQGHRPVAVRSTFHALHFNTQC
jgi:hypothetical protein